MCQKRLPMKHGARGESPLEKKHFFKCLRKTSTPSGCLSYIPPFAFSAHGLGHPHFHLLPHSPSNFFFRFFTILSSGTFAPSLPTASFTLLTHIFVQRNTFLGMVLPCYCCTTSHNPASLHPCIDERLVILVPHGSGEQCQRCTFCCVCRKSSVPVHVWGLQSRARHVFCGLA